MLKKRLALIVLTGCFCVTSAKAGPFGLKMGMSLNDIGGEPKQFDNGKYEFYNVPNPHSAFFMYTITVAPKTGLCQIYADGKTIEVNSFGTEIEIKFREMEKKLETSYGKHVFINELLPGSIWSEPKDWMMGLLARERIYTAIWSPKEGESSHLPANLQNIMLMAKATAINEGYIAVRYRFTNWDACNSELSSKEDKAL